MSFRFGSQSALQATALGFFSLFAVLVTVCTASSVAYAQEVTNTVRIIHQPPPAERLPFPGQSLTLELSLEGTKSFTDPLRIIASLDGKLVDTRAEKSTITEFDVPTYQIQIHAPLAQLSYQFLLYRKDGTVIASDRYTIQRSCLPSLAVAEVKEEPGQTGNQRVAALEVQAKALERDGQGYRRALKLLEELQQHLKEQGQ